MTDSLKIAGVTLTPATSNVSSNVAIPTAVAATSTTNSHTQSYISYSGANGNYLYNWHAAVAYPNGTSSEISTTPASSVCPKQWRLPDNSGNKSWYNLIATAYAIEDGTGGYNKIVSAPLGFTLTGFFYNNIMWRTHQGHYTTRTPISGHSNYQLYFDSTTYYVRPQAADNTGSKPEGFAVRCVAL